MKKRLFSMLTSLTMIISLMGVTPTVGVGASSLKTSENYELITPPFVPSDEYLGSNCVIWEGDKTLNSFNDGLYHLGLDNINAEMGNRLYVYAYPQEGAEIQFVGLLGEDKIWTILADNDGNESFTFDENGKLEIRLTAEMATILEEWSGDIYIRGNNLRIYRMAIRGIGRVYNDIIRYQVSEDQSMLRYVWEVDEEVVDKASLGYVTLDVSPDAGLDTISNTSAIIKAYRSVYAGGQVVTAPEGRVFIISPVTENLTETTEVTCRFKLDSLGGTHERAYKESIYCC